MSYVRMANARCLFWFIRRLKTIEIMKGKKKILGLLLHTRPFVGSLSYKYLFLRNLKGMR